MKNILKTLVIGVAVIFAVGSANADILGFNDSVTFWPTWVSSQDSDNGSDVLGAPQVTGGSLEIDGSGNLTEISINYTSFNTIFKDGDLFIDVGGNSYWDYVLTSGPTNTIYGFEDQLFSATNPGLNNDWYLMTDNVGFSGDYRNNHPYGFDTANAGASGVSNLGTYNFTGFNSNLNTSVLFSGFSLDMEGQDFLIAFGPNCANDVIFESISGAPVPEPATMILFGTGLISLAGYGRRKFNK